MFIRFIISGIRRTQGGVYPPFGFYDIHGALRRRGCSAMIIFATQNPHTIVIAHFKQALLFIIPANKSDIHITMTNLSNLFRCLAGIVFGFTFNLLRLDTNGTASTPNFFIGFKIPTTFFIFRIIHIKPFGPFT